MAVHGDLHRTFIQIVLSRKILPLTEFEELVCYCQRKFDVPLNPEGNLQALAKFVSDVNNRLSPFPHAAQKRRERRRRLTFLCSS
ncbi:hypothetical protein MRX96_033461 [Rhipicephalus microplus]